MTNQPQYYTPDISEFYIGLEVEELDPDYQGQSDGNEWKKKICTKEYLITVFENWRYFQDYRLKFLGHSDVIDLGWTLKIGMGFYIKEVYLKFDIDGHVTIHNGGSYGDYFSYFDGVVKNKSELKKIMSQLSINGNKL